MNPNTATSKPGEKPLPSTSLTVRVRSPETVFFDGQAKAVTSVNSRGPFDVLPGHENFISVIKDKLVVLDQDNKKKDIPIKSGVMKVDENKVYVFLGVDALRKE